MKRQRGMTAIGFVLIAGLVGLVGYGMIRLIPLYLNQMKIRELLSDLKTQYDANDATPPQILNTISKQLDIDMIDYPKRQDFVITKTDTGLRVEVNYEDSVPYIANLSLTAAFDNAVEITR